MSLKGSRGDEFAQFVSDHVLGHVHRNVLPAVVNGKGVTNKLREDRGAARPSLNDFLFAVRILLLDLLHEVIVAERPLLE